MPHVAAAQTARDAGVPIVRTWTAKDYKGEPQIWTILRDRRGLLYFGVSGSEIFQYDGVTWRTIPVNTGTVRALAMDAGGRIWVGAFGKFGYLEAGADGSSHFVSLLDKVPPEFRDFTDVWQVLITPQGKYFRSDKRLFRWDGTNMKVWPTATRFDALSEVKGHVYTSQEGIGLQEIAGDELRPAPGGSAWSQSRKLFLHAYDERRMLVSSRSELLRLYDGQKATAFPTAADDYFKKNQVYTSIPLPDGGFCITTLQGGAVILEHDGRLRRIMDVGAGLNESGVLSAYADMDGALWLGQGFTLARVEMDSPLSMLSRRGFESVVRFQGKLYGGEAGGGNALSRLIANPLTGAYTLQPIASSATQVFDMKVFHDPAPNGHDQLLVASSHGVMRLEGDKLTPARKGVFSLSEQTYEVKPSRKYPNRVFVGHGDGASSLRWEGGQWVDEGRVPNARYRVATFAEEPDGTVWAGVNGGRLLRFEGTANGLSAAKMTIFSAKDGLPNADLLVNSLGGQIFASPFQEGQRMVRWDAATHRFVDDNRFLLPVKDASASARANELPNGDIFSITAGPREQRQALFRRVPDGSYQREEESLRGLSTFSVFRVAQEDDGSLLVTGLDGVLRFDPRRKPAGRQPFPALVRAVHVGSSDLLFGGDAGGGAQTPRLAHDRNSLRFDFAAPVFGNEAATTYQYFLEGADKDWSAPGLQKEANYSSLGPGSYRFRVRAHSLEGQDSQEGDFSFVIRPPWYRTYLAYLVYLILAGLAIFAARRNLVRREREKARHDKEALAAQAKALEVTVAERTREIRQQASEIAAQKDRLERSYSTVELLSDIGREITASLDLDTILFKLYERVNQLLDASVFGVGLYRPEKQQIDYTLAIENGKRYTPYSRDTSDKNQFAVWCIDNRKPMFINDVERESSKYITNYQHAKGVLEDGTLPQPPVSMIYLPLIAQDRVLGVLTVQSFRRDAYTEQHLNLLQNLAAYTTIALDNASAYAMVNRREQEVRERAAELATINHITQALSTQLDMDSAIHLVGEQVREVFQAPIAYVALLDRASMMLSFPYAYGETVKPRPFGDGFTSQIIRTAQPLLINADVNGSSARLGVQRVGRSAASYLGVPIPAGGEMIGVISVQTTDQENRFTDADQRLLSTIAAAVGVTIHNARLFEETRQARAFAEEADAAKSSFLSTVSHELRTPLTSVLGFAKIIRRRLEERLFPLIAESDRKVGQAKRQVLDNLDVVVSEGERLTKLIDDVLDLAKIEAGKFTWNMESIGMSEVIERALTATSSLFETSKLKLIRKVDPDLPIISGDRDRLIQVVINLISNAVKFTPSGSITVAATMRDGEVVVGVTDSGIGIAASDHQKVFEKFKQVGDTLTDKPRGTGLGLPICREIVEHHGGRIWVESEEGKGSTFWFTVPAQPGTQPVSRHVSLESLLHQLRERVADHKPRSKSILVVDDDPNIRSLLQQEFVEAGYSVRLAGDGREALQLIRQETPGLVVLDVMMPEMNGFDVAAVLKNDPVTMDIPIIILSIVEDKERGFRVGVDRYLTKPINTSSLFREVSELLDQGKSRRKVMIVDEDASAVRTLTEVLETGGYHVFEASAEELVASAVSSKPDIIILNSMLSSRNEVVRSIRFEKGLENVLFLIYQ